MNAIKYRLGTFRLHVLLARKLCELGYSVFSFDPQGIGDSEGTFDYKLLSEHYYDIQTGKYDRDLYDAIDFFSKECALDKLLLLGLCGGAISVLMEAAGDRRVDGLVLLNIPVLIEDLARRGQVDNAAKITSSHTATETLKRKLQRLGERDFWATLARMEVDWREESRLVVKSVSVLAQRVGGRIAGLFRPRAAATLALSQPFSTNRLFNTHFQSAFARAMEARKRICFLFAEHDPWTWIFKSEFQDQMLHAGNVHESNYQIEIVPAANHIFSARESQVHLQQRIVSWLDANFPAAPRNARNGTR